MKAPSRIISFKHPASPRCSKRSLRRGQVSKHFPWTKPFHAIQAMQAGICIKAGNLKAPRLHPHMCCPAHAVMTYMQDLHAAVICCRSLPGHHQAVSVPKGMLVSGRTVLSHCRAGPSTGFRNLHCNHIPLPSTNHTAEAWRAMRVKQIFKWSYTWTASHSDSAPRRT